MGCPILDCKIGEYCIGGYTCISPTTIALSVIGIAFLIAMLTPAVRSD